MRSKTKFKAVNSLFVVCLFLWIPAALKAQHPLRISVVDKDTAFNLEELQIQTSFPNEVDCYAYVVNIPKYLGTKGYPTASVDTIISGPAETSIRLFLGKKYRWVRLIPDGIEKKAVEESRYREKNFTGKLINMEQLQQLQQGLLDFYENNGYPFASAYLDSIRLDDDRIDAVLRVNKGPLYHLDSIRVLGKAKISKTFLERYLGLPKKSIYNKTKLEQVGRRILELPYLQETQPNDITMLGAGAILNLYLAPRRSSQVNFLVGFLPNAAQDGKLQLTADVNLNLKNVLGSGETILLNWQSLQAKSPRLNLGYQHPYIFNSPFGIDFLFDLFKKDSTFLQINAQLGIQYLLSANRSGKLFVQWQNSFLLGAGVDTNQVIATKKLPPNIDVSAINVGVDYDWNNTDYRLNPRKGNELRIIGAVGTKKITQNTDILNIKDASFNYASLYDSVKQKSYQLRVKLSAAHYFPLGKQATLRAAVNAGVFVSPSTFRNELFQIGGYKLLRGFTEESIYASQYGVLTAEYRYRLGLNSFFFAFADGAWVKNKYQSVDLKNTFIGGGIGLNFETGFGLLNISYAVGKRDDIKFSFRESSKIHFGYINYF